MIKIGAFRFQYGLETHKEGGLTRIFDFMVWLLMRLSESEKPQLELVTPTKRIYILKRQVLILFYFFFFYNFLYLIARPKQPESLGCRYDRRYGVVDGQSVEDPNSLL